MTLRPEKIRSLAAALLLLAVTVTSHAAVIAATDFDGRTLTTVNRADDTATDLNWTVDGVEDPGDMTALREDGAFLALFDGTATTQNMFAPALNVGNSNIGWRTNISLTAAAGNKVTLTDVTFVYWAISGAQVPNVRRLSDFTITLYDPSGALVDSVFVDDVVGNPSAPVSAVFAAPIELTDPGTYRLEIFADEAPETGNHIGIDDLSINGTVASGFLITAFTPDADPATLALTWGSQAGKLYDIAGTTGPSANPQVWTPVVSDIAATPPENTEVFTKPGDAFTAFAVIEKPVPPLFEDDFETDKGWTTGVDGGTDTAWERGTPSVIGPPAANSPVTCYGTNIDAKYGTDVNIYLRSPAIDLSGATSATLSFQHFYDIEVQWDAGTVRVLRADLQGQLGSKVLYPLDGTVTEWTAFSAALPPEALGENIVLEFGFTSDNVEPLAQAGWYIDDVSVTVE